MHLSDVKSRIVDLFDFPKVAITDVFIDEQLSNETSYYVFSLDSYLFGILKSDFDLCNSSKDIDTELEVIKIKDRHAYKLTGPDIGQSTLTSV